MSQHRQDAHTQLTAVFLRHAAYFKVNPLTRKDFLGLVDTLIPGEDIILLQLLCPVPAELNDGVMLSLTQGGASLQHLSPEARARVPTLAGYDELVGISSNRSLSLTVVMCAPRTSQRVAATSAS